MRNYRRVHHIDTRAGWRSMQDAPRDGTAVELMCTYGIAPWYGIFKWADRGFGKPTWVDARDERKNVSDEAHLHWRPYAESGQYVDPTGGAQDTNEYWLRHV